MTEPRHISMCISEWLDDYEEKNMPPCPFNLPDALDAIRDELSPKDQLLTDVPWDINGATQAEAITLACRGDRGTLPAPIVFRDNEGDAA